MPDHTPLEDLGQHLTLILLDRDGVINAESADFIKAPNEWRALPGAASAIARLQSRFDIAVCTNQSGVGRGLLSLQDLDGIHAKLQQTLSEHNAQPLDIFFCPHAPNEGCPCRKPLPGLLHTAMDHFQVQPGNTLFVGDSARDIEAGLAAGCHVALVLTGNGPATAASMPHIPSMPDLDALASVLINPDVRRPD